MSESRQPTCVSCRWMGTASYKYLDRSSPRPERWIEDQAELVSAGYPARRWKGKWKSFDVPVCRIRPPVCASATEDVPGPVTTSLWPAVEPHVDWCSRHDPIEEES